MCKLLTVDKWKTALGESGGWRSYCWALKKYCEFTGKTPDQLIAERDREVISESKEERIKADNTVIEFYQWMRSQKYLPGTCTTAYNAVRSFYAANDVALTKKKPKTFKGTPEKPSDPVKLEDIPRLVEAAETDERKAVISFLAESGCRPSILTALKVRDIQSQLGENIAVIKIPATLRNYRGENVNKAQVAHKICVTKKTLAYLAKTIKNRKVNLNSQLFPMCIRTINYIVEDAAKKIGVENISPRSFRKTFNDTAIAMKIGDEIKEFLMGHKIESPKAAYFSAESPLVKKEIIESYSKIVSNLGG